MPTIRVFDYKCVKCDHVWEAYIDINSDEPIECPACGSTDTVKLPSGTRFNMNKTPYEEFL